VKALEALAWVVMMLGALILLAMFGILYAERLN
jgi:hypothetical protein